jgi:hypothetical protein
LLDELERFTGINDAHDDLTDCLAYAWNAAQDMPRPRPSSSGNERAHRRM